MQTRSITDHLVLFFSTGFYSGYSPVAPGTAGSVVGVGIFWLIHGLPAWLYILITLAIVLIGIPLSTRAERLLGQKDAKPIVIDEIAGQLIALFMAPLTPVAVIGGFLLFRLFDIWKFGPMARLEKLPGGTGIMLDDVAAGLFALITLQLLIQLVPQ